MHFRFARVAGRVAFLAACSIFCAAVAQASTITVNSLADDVFPDGAGAIFDINGAPIALAASKCTLRMAIASANLDLAVGGATFGCTPGSGADTIDFSAALNLAATPGTITLASKAMNEAPASYSPPNTSALAVSGPLTITGPGASQLTIDGALTSVDGRRLMTVSNGDQNVDMQFAISGLRFYRGRAVDTSAGCMFSSKSTSITDVTFENCESIGGPTAQGFGGALGIGNLLAGTAVPSVSITNSSFLGNRAVRGTSAGRADNGAAFIGSGTRKVGAVTITNTLFNGNSAERQGAMLIQNAASVTISGSHFNGNAAHGTNAGTITGAGRYGGFLIQIVAGNVDINTTRVNGNVANEERGGFGVQSIGGTVTLNQVDITGNYVNRGRIGGFEVLTDTFDANGNCLGAQLRPVNISEIRVQGNSVASNTGGFRVGCSGAVTITDAWVLGNETRGYRLAQTDVVSTGNSALQIFSATDATAAQSTATLTRVLFDSNSTDATSGGGGFGVVNINGLGAFTADSIAFRNNFVAQNEGLSLRANGAGRNYLVINSEFSGNHANAFAAIFITNDGNYTLRNSTVSGNTGTNTVGVNANTNTPGGVQMAVEHSTIARNTGGASEALGVLVFANQPNPGVTTPTLFGGANAVISVKNSILGSRAPGYTGTNTIGWDATVTNFTATNDLLEWSGGAPAGFCSGTGMKCNVGALVSPLADNGSTNAEGLRTMALMAGSPAINAGGAVLGGLTTDQRGAGFPRVRGGIVDIGAFEADPATAVGCTLDVDGNGTYDALTDGLLLLRAMSGLTGTAVTNGAVGGGATRTTWAQIQPYLNSNCGTNFAP